MLLRALGQNPTDQELRELLDDVPNHVEFAGFINLFQARGREVFGPRASPPVDCRTAY